MKLCFFLARFPELSQTFVLNQILDLLDRGHDVEIIAARPGKLGHLHAGAQAAERRQHSLTQRIVYNGTPESLLVRAGTTPWKALTALLREPRTTAQAFNIYRFGWFALTGSVLHAALPLLGTTRR